MINQSETDAKTEFVNRFKQCTENREGASEYLDFLFESDFFTAPASTRFHGNYEGGLCEHSLNVDDCLSKLLEVFDADETINRNVASFCALLHDVCKISFYKKGLRNVKDEISGQWLKKEVWEVDEKVPMGHGEKSCIMLMAYMKLSLEELLAIRWHMGGFDSSVKGGEYGLGKAQGMYKLVTLLHSADLIASNLYEKTI